MTNLTFPAGTYYIGDPCYAVQGTDWDSILNESDYFATETKTRGMWAGSTSYGNGTYIDQFGNRYPVDAGLIGIMPIAMCNFGRIRWENGQWIDERGIILPNGENFKFKPGNIFHFETDFIVQYDEGIFKFGEILIDTVNEESDDDDNYWE